MVCLKNRVTGPLSRQVADEVPVLGEILSMPDCSTKNSVPCFRTRAEGGVFVIVSERRDDEAGIQARESALPGAFKGLVEGKLEDIGKSTGGGVSKFEGVVAAAISKAQGGASFPIAKACLPSQPLA